MWYWPTLPVGGSTTMKLNLYTGAAFYVVGAGIGFLVFDKRAVAVEPPVSWRRGLKWTPCGPSRCRTIGCSADHRRVGRCAGPHLDHSPGGFARARRATCDDHASHRSMLRPGAAGARIRSGGQPDRPLGRTGQGLRLAGFEPRHHRRLQRQRLDWRQRPRPRNRVGELWGGAGRGPAGRHLQSFDDNMVLKFTQDGKFLMQIGKPRAARAATISRTCGCRPRRLSTPRPTSCTSPMATATIA